MDKLFSLQPLLISCIPYFSVLCAQIYMKPTLVFLSLASIWTLIIASKLTTKPEIGPKKILILLPVASPSHHNIFSPFIDELLKRGHHVTFVSPRPRKEKPPRFREIILEDNSSQWVAAFTIERFKGPSNLFKETIMMPRIGRLFNDMVLENHEVLALKEEQFDLVITETFFFQESLLGFAHHFGCPSMALIPIGYMQHLNYFTGGAFNPSYVPNVLGTGSVPETLFDRFYNTVTAVFWMLVYQIKYLPEIEDRMHKAFPNAPPVLELMKNVSLTLINNNNVLMHAVPLAPSVIEVAGIHIKPGKPLPTDLKKWMDESKDGVVYFSLGSNILPDLLPEGTKKALFKSFGKLKQRVLVKWNAEIPPNPPGNCRFEKWLPQQEILAHSNLKVFVTHGGLLSTQESVYFGAALVAMPVFGDQFTNSRIATEQGFAVTIPIYDCTAEHLDAALSEVIHNPKYRARSKELSTRFRLYPIEPLEKAVYYTEKLIELGNFKHLQPSSVDLYWYQYMLLDVIALICLILYVTYRIVRYICCLVLRRCKSTKAKSD